MPVAVVCGVIALATTNPHRVWAILLSLPFFWFALVWTKGMPRLQMALIVLWIVGAISTHFLID